ncbi:MAG: efflux RND transporter periplasmic adaptor subunit [Planctomycetes bacterium]|nr:efflux RND transporter periplasmic adaptor subunit [Planctomycetota bacterium]
MKNREQPKEYFHNCRAQLTKLYAEAKTCVLGHRQLSISIVVILLGLVITVTMVKFKRQPKQVRGDNPAPLVKVIQLKKQDVQMIVSGLGTVIPKVQVEISSQVSGKVVSINPRLENGGFIRADEDLLQIDPRDYELAVRQIEAVVAEAAVKLDMEKAEADVAIDEWQQLHPGTKPDSALVFRGPQIRQAEAQLASAKAKLAVAQLNLDRTVLSLPVDVRIISKKVNLGQYITAGTNIGTAYGIDAVEIEVPLKDEDLAWFDITDGNVAAEVKAEFAGKNRIWKGFAKRTTGQVDISSRLVSVVIEVNEPFKHSENSVPLIPGMFTEVFIRGNILKDAVLVPRDAIRGRDKVWVFDNGKLHIGTLKILRSDRDYAYTVDSLRDGDRIIISPLNAVTEGMSVRIKKDESLSDE